MGMEFIETIVEMSTAACIATIRKKERASINGKMGLHSRVISKQISSKHVIS